MRLLSPVQKLNGTTRSRDPVNEPNTTTSDRQVDGQVFRDAPCPEVAKISTSWKHDPDTAQKISCLD